MGLNYHIPFKELFQISHSQGIVQSPINHNAIIKHKGGKGDCLLCIRRLFVITLAKTPYHLDRAKIKRKTPQLSSPGAFVDGKLAETQLVCNPRDC